MWDCGSCGCMAIAADVAACPMCGKEHGMPKATTGGASSAAAGQPDGGLPPPPPASAPKAEHAAYAAEHLGVPAEQAESMTKAELTAAAQEAAAGPAPAPGSAPESEPARAPAPAPKKTTTE